MSAGLRASIVVVVALLLAAPAGVAGAAGGTIKGTIRGKDPAVPIANAVVMIEGPSQPAPAGAPHKVMDQVHNQFAPRVLAIGVGTTVDFPNSDPWLHNVFSTSQAKKFDLGMYAQGKVKSVTFDQPGVVDVRCNVHPKMEGYIVVNANPFVAVTDEQGSYSISDVPPGTYKLRVWQEDMKEAQMPVTIADGQVRAIDVKLESRR